MWCPFGTVEFSWTVKFRVPLRMYACLAMLFFVNETFALTLNKCTGKDGVTVFQDSPCPETLQKEAEAEQRKRSQEKEKRLQANQLQAEREKKWEARDVERMKGANPYGAAVSPPGDRVLRVAAQCGAVVGRAISCRLDTQGASAKCADRIRFYANLDKRKEKEGHYQFELTTLLATKLQAQEPISCVDVELQLADLFR